MHLLFLFTKRQSGVFEIDFLILMSKIMNALFEHEMNKGIGLFGNC